MDGNKSSESKGPSVGRVAWTRAVDLVLSPAPEEPDEVVDEPPVTLAAQARKIEQLQQALISRDLIGQAKGILMERHRITAEQAFDLLVRASQDTNTKLISVVGRLVHTGAIDGGQQARPGPRAR